MLGVEEAGLAALGEGLPVADRDDRGAVVARVGDDLLCGGHVLGGRARRQHVLGLVVVLERAPVVVAGRGVEVVGQLEAEDLGIERDLGFFSRNDVLGFAEAVPLAFEGEVRVRQVAAFQADEETFALGGRADHVVEPLEQQERRGDPVGVLRR